jgi:8-oxo-dGTP pyrophosphatase MutT (NUDIX family)
VTDTPQVEGWTRTWPQCALGSKALLLDGSGRLVLVKPTYNERLWYLIGGALEPEESFEQALTREVYEETGLHRAPGRLLVLEQVAPDAARKKPFGVDAIFAVEPLAPGEFEAIRLPSNELRDTRLIDCAEIDTWTLPALARTIRAALAALDQGVTILLPPHQPEPPPADPAPTTHRADRGNHSP